MSWFQNIQLIKVTFFALLWIFMDPNSHFKVPLQFLYLNVQWFQKNVGPFRGLMGHEPHFYGSHKIQIMFIK